MHDAELAIEPAFYDHEDDNVQQERVAADWGADEVFATVPRRRMRGERRVATGLHAVTRPRGAGDHHDELLRREWIAAREAEAAAELAVEAPAPELDVLPDPVEMTEGVAFESTAAWAEEPVIAANGRKTVTITGRPEGAPPAPRPIVADRRRPPRTVDERIGGRPDRVAGWAFGMGILLIVIAAVS
jgi:hypothetical protein